ncbi:MAG: FIST C-terminal domain-containing protein [Chlorobium sp.]
MFSCVGRKLVLGRRIQEEVDAVREIIGLDVPLIGFYTYGEIGPIDKTKKELSSVKFHNETVVLWVLGKE